MVNIYIYILFYHEYLSCKKYWERNEPREYQYIFIAQWHMIFSSDCGYWNICWFLLFSVSIFTTQRSFAAFFPHRIKQLKRIYHMYAYSVYKDVVSHKKWSVNIEIEILINRSEFIKRKKKSKLQLNILFLVCVGASEE